MEPGSMLWLIQRDFLEGKSVEAMVKESLAPVANPHNDRDIAQARSSLPAPALYATTGAQLNTMQDGMQVNKIRESLHLIARNSSAFGLVQPHLERTRLCTIPDAELDPRYLVQRAGLRKLVLRLARPKASAAHPASLNVPFMCEIASTVKR